MTTKITLFLKTYGMSSLFLTQKDENDHTSHGNITQVKQYCICHSCIDDLNELKMTECLPGFLLISLTQMFILYKSILEATQIGLQQVSMQYVTQTTEPSAKNAFLYLCSVYLHTSFPLELTDFSKRQIIDMHSRLMTYPLVNKLLQQTNI